MVIRSENSRPNAWVYVDIKGVDVGSYVKNAQKILAEKINAPGRLQHRLEW